MTRIVDTHTHVLGPGHWPSRYFDQIAYNWAYAPRPTRDPADVREKIEPGLLDPEGDQMVADMDAAGVDVSLVLPIDWGPDYDEPELNQPSPQEVHRQVAAMSERHPGRLLMFAAVDPRRPEAVDILSEAHKNFGACGLKLYPPNGFYPYDPVCFPVYDYCEQNNLPILFHTGRGGLPTTAPRFADVAFLRDVQARFLRMPIWIGHAGGKSGWDDALTVLSTGASSYLELSAGIWDDTPEEDIDRLAVLVAKAAKRFGAHRLLFGSDHVSGRRVRGREFLPHVVKAFLQLPERAKKQGETISEGDMDLIMGANAAEQIGLRS